MEKELRQLIFWWRIENILGMFVKFNSAVKRLTYVVYWTNFNNVYVITYLPKLSSFQSYHSYVSMMWGYWDMTSWIEMVLRMCRAMCLLAQGCPIPTLYAGASTIYITTLKNACLHHNFVYCLFCFGNCALELSVGTIMSHHNIIRVFNCKILARREVVEWMRSGKVERN